MRPYNLAQAITRPHTNFVGLPEPLRPTGGGMSLTREFKPKTVEGKPSRASLRYRVPNKVRELRYFAIHSLGIKQPHRYRKQELTELCLKKAKSLK